MTVCSFNNIIRIRLLMRKNNFVLNKVVIRRIYRYQYQKNTKITHNDKYIKVSSELGIKGVHNVLWLFRDGTSKLDFETVGD